MLNVFAVRMATYFMINRCNESDAHMTRQAASERQVVSLLQSDKQRQARPLIAYSFSVSVLTKTKTNMHFSN